MCQSAEQLKPTHHIIKTDAFLRGWLVACVQGYTESIGAGVLFIVPWELSA